MVQCLRSQEKQDWGGSSKFSGLGFAFTKEKIHLPHSVADEYMAAMKFLSFAQDLNLSSIILEGDFEVIIKALSIVKMNHSPPMVTSSLRLNYLHMSFVLLVFVILVDKAIL